MSDEQTQEEKKNQAPAPGNSKDEASTSQPPLEDKQPEDDSQDVEVPAKFKSLIEEVEKMSVLDLAELVKILEKKFGVSAAPAVGIAVPGGAAPAGADAETEEKSSFNIELVDIGSNKIGVIKAVRDVTQKGLKDTKEIVDSAPQVIKEEATKEEADEIKKKFEEAGAKVELK